MTQPATGHTITVTDGTADVLRRVQQHLQQTLAWTGDAVGTHEQRTDRLRQALEEIHTYLGALHSVLSSSPHDRDLIVAPASRGDGGDEAGRSLYFRYSSGYHGAVIFWPGTGQTGRWQIHT
jgi:hypothetical protein